MNRPIQRFFGADHERLAALLRRSIADPGHVDREAFDAFRRGILKHIGMEEKVLFPAGREAGSGQPLRDTARLRVDHGAIASLLVPTPTPAILAELESVLAPHNQREEGPGGVYEQCDRALGEVAAERLVESLGAFPEPPLRPHNDGPGVMEHVAANLALARRQWDE